MQYRPKVRAKASEKERGGRDCNNLFIQPALATEIVIRLYESPLRFFDPIPGLQTRGIKSQLIDVGPLAKMEGAPHCRPATCWKEEESSFCICVFSLAVLEVTYSICSMTRSKCI